MPRNVLLLTAEGTHPVHRGGRVSPVRPATVSTAEFVPRNTILKLVISLSERFIFIFCLLVADESSLLAFLTPLRGLSTRRYD